MIDKDYEEKYTEEEEKKMAKAIKEWTNRPKREFNVDYLYPKADGNRIFKCDDTDIIYLLEDEFYDGLDKDISNLIESIREHGIVTPIVVGREQDERHAYKLMKDGVKEVEFIIDGAKRYLALKRLYEETGDDRYKEVYMRIYDFTDKTKAKQLRYLHNMKI